tara:strand:- start:488 stop:607 length:120 start_codon:yes stop_codon:yes gene_type:complete
MRLGVTVMTLGVATYWNAKLIQLGITNDQSKKFLIKAGI